MTGPRQEFRDRVGRLIGTLQERAGRIEARDAVGRLRGSYDINRDETRDAEGRLVARGDATTSFFNY